MDIEKKRSQTDKKKIFIIICVIVITLAASGSALYMLGLSSFKPTILDKDTFSESEKAVIAKELDIPADDISIKNMHLSHAKETFIRITLTAPSLDILSSYEYRGIGSYDNNIHYLKKSDDPHEDIECIVRSEQPCELDFELSDTWNSNLRNLITRIGR